MTAMLALSETVTVALIGIGGTVGLGAFGGIIKAVRQLARLESRMEHVEKSTDLIWSKINGKGNHLWLD